MTSRQPSQNSVTYLDYAASTPIAKDVVAAMAPWHSPAVSANPHSIHHIYGQKARTAIEHAKDQIATCFSVRSAQILLTSGATEANNLALFGLFSEGRPKRLITASTEHPSVLETAMQLRTQGVDIDILPVDCHGAISLDVLEDRLRRPTGLVSLMAVNNETGHRHPVSDIAALCKSYDVPFHCDATQAIRLTDMTTLPQGLSAMTISGHKIYGPQGTGALVLGDSVTIKPQTFGGAQQSGLRAGTIPTALTVGLGAACAQIMHNRAAALHQILHLDQKLRADLRNEIDNIQIVADTPARCPGILTVIVPKARAVDILPQLHSVALSSGAACATGGGRPSPVLTAMGYTPEHIDQAYRWSFGPDHTAEDMHLAVKHFGAVINS